RVLRDVAADGGAGAGQGGPDLAPPQLPRPRGRQGGDRAGHPTRRRRLAGDDPARRVARGGGPLAPPLRPAPRGAGSAGAARRAARRGGGRGGDVRPRAGRRLTPVPPRQTGLVAVAETIVCVDCG